MLTYEVAYKLNVELKCKPRIRAKEIDNYAEECGAVRASKNYDFAGGRVPFIWTEENYQTLKIKINN